MGIYQIRRYWLKQHAWMNPKIIFKINSSPKASLSNTGTVLFSPRSKLLRLRTEMPCSCAAQSREEVGG
jgi:hypothetical protein